LKVVKQKKIKKKAFMTLKSKRKKNYLQLSSRKKNLTEIINNIMTSVKKIQNRNKCMTPLTTYSLLGHYLKMIPIEKNQRKKNPKR